MAAVKSAAAMRYPDGDLAILSAESYDDGSLIPFPDRPAPKTKKKTPPTTAGNDGPRKRTKRQSSDPDENEGDKKRSRGRPRLDMKDETAADVRDASSA